MKTNPVWRLLRHNISKAQLVGYALANLAGLTIVLTAIQFYRDVTGIWDATDSFMTRDYLVVSQRVNSIGGILGKGQSASFTDADIENLERQPWVRRVGRFTPAAFSVSASLDAGGSGISSALFLESIPDEFFDVCPTDWGYEPGKPVPLIISKDYLALYNFGFASSRGLPQISESMVGMIPLRLSVSGGGRQEWLPAKIVGFSSRLGTIAAPQEFMEWANAGFADGDKPMRPSRLIVEVSSPGDPAIEKYLRAHNLEVAGDKADSGKAAYFLTIVTAVAVGVGVVISVLAFFILLLSIYLLLQKNHEKIQTLLMLGYTPRSISKYYMLIVGCINATILIVSVVVMVTSAIMWRTPLEGVGVKASSLLPTILIGVAITIAVTAINFTAIVRKVR